MIAKVKILEITYDGYERFYKFKLLDKGELLHAHGLDPNYVYIDCGLKVCNESEISLVELYIEWVLEVEKVEQNIPDRLLQTIIGSTHVECIGTVEEILSRSSFTVNMADYGLFLVNLEYDELMLKKSDKVSFKGDLKLNFVTI